jgi:hypothetical protein
MINQNDVNYIKWLAQRLVHRYGEDPKLLITIDEIISKIISGLSLNKKYNDLILENTTICIKNLQEIITYTNNLPNLIKDNSNKIIIDKNTKTFEDIDIAEILK